VVTALVSMLSQPKPESELKALVYGLTELPRSEGVAWYRRPVFIAIVAGVLCLLLNFLFW
jgi:SSS family solute:Na+ symporter